MPGDRLVLKEGAQHSYYTLRIGSGNYNTEDYVTDSGKIKHGWTVGLWLIIEDRPETEKTFMAFEGKNILFEGYNIHVSRIVDTDISGLYTEIEVRRASLADCFRRMLGQD